MMSDLDPLVKVVLNNEETILRLDSEKKEKVKKVIENLLDTTTSVDNKRRLSRILYYLNAKNEELPCVKHRQPIKFTRFSKQARFLIESISSQLSREWKSVYEMYIYYYQKAVKFDIKPLSLRTFQLYINFLKAKNIVETHIVSRGKKKGTLVRFKGDGEIEKTVKNAFKSIENNISIQAPYMRFKIKRQLVPLLDIILSLDSEWKTASDLYKLYCQECDKNNIKPLTIFSIYYYLDRLDENGIIEMRIVNAGTLKRGGGYRRILRIGDDYDAINNLARELNEFKKSF